MMSVGKRRIKRRESNNSGGSGGEQVYPTMGIEGISGRRLLCVVLWAVVSTQDGCNGFDNSWTLIMLSSAYSYVRRGGGRM